MIDKSTAVGSEDWVSETERAGHEDVEVARELDEMAERVGMAAAIGGPAVAMLPPAAASPPVAPPAPGANLRRPLDFEEREIKDNVLRLGSMVSDQITRAIQSL